MTTTEATPPPPRRSLARRVLSGAARASLGLLVGLALAEAAFWARDGGAFPHLNVYVADPALGARLMPGATTKIAYGGNPPTSIRINTSGFRGADFGPPSDDEIVVIGDSQVFGLGVEEGETTPAALAKRLSRPVINAGVPTYGPPEYAAVLDEIFASRKPKLVVYVVNLANDLFEANRRNIERHSVWDGWAVRRETAPVRTQGFPGRDLVYRRSHLAYAARQAWYKGRAKLDDRGFASEGTWRDIAGRAASIEDAQTRALAESARLSALRELEIGYVETEARAARAKVDSIIQGSAGLPAEAYLAYEAASLNPGDLLEIGCGEECSRPVPVTAEMIRQGAALRARMEEAIRRRAAAEPTPEHARGLAKLDDWKQKLAEREARLAALQGARAIIARAESPMAAPLRAAKAAADAHGAALLVVALPLDVMVDPAEWKKYGAEPVDMSRARVLAEDIVETAEALGAAGLDATAALRAAEPGAFLQGDIHMSPKGHAALAEAIAARLAERPLPPAPKGGLAPRRTRPPSERDFADAGEVNVKGSTAAGCETKMIREWLRVVCRKKKDGPAPTAVKVESGGHGELVAIAADGATTLLAPILIGDELRAKFSWDDRARTLVVRFNADTAELDMRFEPAGEPSPKAAPPEGFDRVCACYKEARKAATCGGLAAFIDARCLATYPDDCAGLLACALGDPFQAPKCERGWANAGATAHCYKLCGPDLPCAQGACTEWDGGHVCM